MARGSARFRDLADLMTSTPPSALRRSPAAGALLVLAGLGAPALAGAEALEAAQRVEIIGAGPLRGAGLARDAVPAAVQSFSDADLDRRHAQDVAELLLRQAGSVSLNAMQGNPFQPDLQFRGFTASPLLGTPQGLSVYLDGVRLNQPFGDVLSWDLIPRSAIATVALMPGSNPLFGLNTLGGALSLQTKDGRSHPGTSVQLLGGSFGRVAAEFESGGATDEGTHGFVTGQRLHERGWRDASPSDLRQLFGKLGTRLGGTEWSLSMAAADNTLTGNGLQEGGALQRRWASVYTRPDQTFNRGTLLNLSATHKLDSGATLSGQLHARRINTHTLNGDLNDAALSDPEERFNGLLNRSATQQQQRGGALQAEGELRSGGLVQRWLLGAAFEASRIHFTQGTQFGVLEPDRSVTAVDGPGAFADGTQDSENAVDARVDLRGRNRTHSVYASNALQLDPRTQLTLAARYNRYRTDTADAITPGGGSGSLDGHHVFRRFNPGLSASFQPDPTLTLYGSLNRASRAPSAIELGCADPENPCRLPNAFAGDPPLKQVITTSFEAGARGRSADARMQWSAGLFRADNRDDLLFVADNSAGYGYFKNFGKTRRQGLELAASARLPGGWQFGGNLMLLDATYRSTEVVDGAANSSNDVAQAGAPGTEGRITLRPGDRIPLLPRRLLKLQVEGAVAEGWRLSADLLASSGATARGNENGQHRPDGSVYTGPGRSAGYAVLNLALDVEPAAGLKLFAQLQNAFNRRYSTAAQLGANGFDAQGQYVARALPRLASGEVPVPRGTFFAPGAPRALWIGARYTFE